MLFPSATRRALGIETDAAGRFHFEREAWDPRGACGEHERVELDCDVQRPNDFVRCTQRY